METGYELDVMTERISEKKKKKDKKESREIEEFTLWKEKTNHRHASKYIQNNLSLIKDSNKRKQHCVYG